MQIWVVTCGWNEEPILPFYLDHYSKIADKILYFDNDSTDNSLSLLKKCPTVAIRTLDTSGFDHEPPAMAINLAIMSVKNNIHKEIPKDIDWLIVCDADEFVYHDDVRGLLSSLRGSYTIVKCHGYEMISESFPSYDLPITAQVKDGYRDALNHEKCLIFSPHEVDDINYTKGAHNCRPTGNVKIYYSDGVKNLHYKALSLEYFRAKHAALSRTTHNERGNEWCMHYIQSEEKRTAWFKRQLLSKRPVIA